MEDKDRDVWDALDAKAAELELGGVYGLVGREPEVARGIVREVGGFGEDDQQAGLYLSGLLQNAVIISPVTEQG